MSIRKFLHDLIFTPFKSADEMWRKRVKFGEINEFCKFQVIATDLHGYNLPLIHNMLWHYKEQKKWQESDSLNYEYLDDDRRKRAEKIFEFVYSFIKDRIDKQDTILDVGCNTGFYLQKFYERGHTNLHGIDPQKVAVEYGRKKRPHINFHEAFFGPEENDVECDVLVFFGSIFRIPYSARIFDAIDRCTKKYVVGRCQEATDDMHRDLSYNLGKKGFICIDKRVVYHNDREVIADDFIPYGTKDADGPMIELRKPGDDGRSWRNFYSYFVFRRIEPRK